LEKILTHQSGGEAIKNAIDRRFVYWYTINENGGE